MNILESGKRGWVQRWRQDEGEREREKRAAVGEGDRIQALRLSRSSTVAAVQIFY